MVQQQKQISKAKESDWMSALIRFSAKYVPDALPMVLILTVVVAVLAAFLTDASPVTVAQSWYDGFWGMLSFTMQVSYLMLTGHLVADTSVIKRINLKIARIPKTTAQTVLLYFTVIAIANYCHFFIAMAIAIMLGKAILVEQDKIGNKIPYSMLVAVACIGILFTCGFTPGTPLLVATSGHFMEETIGILTLSQTMLISPVIVSNILMFAILSMVFLRLLKKKSYDECPRELLETFKVEVEDCSAYKRKKYTTPAETIDNMQSVQMLLGIAGLVLFLVNLFRLGMDGFNMNSINFALLMLALLLHRTPANLLASARRGINSTMGIILQYPFYAGIFGIISYTGLGAVISQFFVSVAPPRLFAFIVWVFSALLNLFVPSGGTQFMVEAPYIMPAAIEMGVNPAYVVNAFTMGDVITNLIQPFWTIPVVTVFGLKFRDIYPYMILAFIVGAGVMGGILLFWMF